jgi:hypothetical protein
MWILEMVASIGKDKESAASETPSSEVCAKPSHRSCVRAIRLSRPPGPGDLSDGPESPFQSLLPGGSRFRKDAIFQSKMAEAAGIERAFAQLPRHRKRKPANPRFREIHRLRKWIAVPRDVGSTMGSI